MPESSAPDPSTEGLACSVCQLALPRDAAFCLRCGNRVPGRPSGAGLPGARPVRPSAATIMGVAAGLTPGVVPGAANAPPAAAAGDDPSTPAAPVRSAHKTIMGVAIENVGGVPGPAGAMDTAAGAPPGPVRQNSTMHGVAPADIGAQTNAPAPVATGRAAPAAGRTMHGVAAPPGPSAPHRARREAPPMMGGSEPGVPPDTVPPGYPDPAPQAVRQPSATASLDFDVPGLPRRRARGTSRSYLPVVVAALLLATAALVAVAVVALRSHDGAAPALLPAQVRVAPGGGLMVAVTLPGAAPGTKVRYHGADVAVDPHGSAEFPIGNLPTAVGTVDLPVEVVPPAGAAVARTARILIAYRVEPDLQHLGEIPAVIHLRFLVPPGAALVVAGQAIQVSNGTGIAAITVPGPIPVTSAEGVYRQRLPIRVTVPGSAAVDGEYDLRVPRAALRVDAPAPVTLTAADRVAIRGRAPNATRALVAGHPATLVNGVFSADVPVASGRTDVTVVVYTPGAAPAQATVAVYRDVTPQQYLAGAAQGAAAIAAGRALPDGTRLRLQGRVLGNVVNGPDGPTFQLLGEDRACRPGQCLVWVNPTAAVDVHNGDRIEVIGETHGTRAYTDQTGQRHSDPVIVALFVQTARR